jgi:hypothetical protein
MNQLPSTIRKILYIGTHSSAINIDDEVKAIQDIMDVEDSKFFVDNRTVDSTGDVDRAIQRTGNSPQIIHISGHGTEEGKIKILEKDTKNGEELRPETLAEYIKNAGDVDCVLLNFCYSKEAANLIAKNAQNVKWVIGINDDIDSTSAVEFSTAFYQELRGKSLNSSVVDKAFSKGQAAAYQRNRDRHKYIKLPLPKPEPEMQMIEPTEGSTVPYPCECKGTFNNLYEGASMWAYVNATIEGKFYLVLIRNYPGRSTDGEWQIRLYIGPPEGDDDDYRIGVLMVDPKTTPGLRSEYDKAIKELDYFALDSLPTSGTSIFGDRVVKRQ